MKPRNRSHMLSLLMILCLMLCVPLPAVAAEPGDYTSNASGGLRIGWVLNNRTNVLVDEPTILKDVMNDGWLRLRTELESHLVEQINELGSQSGITVASDLATIEDAELSVMETATGVSLKYVLHNNEVQLTVEAPWPSWTLSYIVFFDVETVFAVQTTRQGQRLQLADATLTIRNTQIYGTNIVSDLAKAVIASSVQNSLEAEGQFDLALLPVLRAIDRRLAPLVARLGEIPQDVIHFDIDIESEDGAITLCFKSDSADACTFPAVQERTANY